MIQAVFKTEVKLTDVKNNSLILSYFKITQEDDPDPDINRYHIMLESKYEKDVRLQILSTGTVNAFFIDLDEFHKTSRYWNSVFKNDKCKLLSPIKIQKWEFGEVDYISEEDLEKTLFGIEAVVNGELIQNNLEYTIFVPTETGYGWIPKTVSREEYFEHLQIREKWKKEIIDEKMKFIKHKRATAIN